MLISFPLAQSCMLVKVRWGGGVVKRQFCYLLDYPVSKGPQWEHSWYLLGYSEKVVRELVHVHLSGEKHFKPRPQNGILVPL